MIIGICINKYLRLPTNGLYCIRVNTKIRIQMLHQAKKTTFTMVIDLIGLSVAFNIWVES